jgi:hypothetical protein
MSDLFSAASQPTGPHSARSAPETSSEAAEKIKPRLPSIRQRVMDFALDAGAAGFIDEELTGLAEDERLFHRSIIPRRVELNDEGWIVDSGRRRNNGPGNSCVIWLHRDFADDPPALRARETRDSSEKAKTKAEGREMAGKLEQWATSMAREGRAMFAGGLQDAARIMRKLAGG